MKRVDSQATVICDVDGVVADLTPAWLDALLKLYPDCPDPRQNAAWDSWDIADVIPQKFLEPLFELLGSYALYETVPAIHGALEGIEAIRLEGLRVVFATSCVPGHAGAKLLWLFREKFVETIRHNYDYVEASDKTLLRGSVIIDDRPKTCHDFMRLNGPHSAILFMQRQLHIKHTRGLYVSRNWTEVYHTIKELKKIGHFGEIE